LIGLKKHITEEVPLAATPEEIDEWEDADSSIIALLIIHTNPELHRHFEHEPSAAKAWKALETVHRKEGLLAQANLLTRITLTKLPRTADLLPNLNSALEDIQHFFDMGTLEEDKWKMMFLLAMMGDDWEHVRSGMDTLLAGGSLTSRMVIQRIEQEHQRLTGQEAERGRQETALAALTKKQGKHTKGNDKSPTCTNCKRSNHTTDKCWSKGGSAEPPAWLALKRKLEAESKKPAANIATTGNESDEAHICISNEHIPTISGLSTTDDRTLALLDTNPFFLDTGATTHISPDASDFTSLKTISPRSIKGMSGDAIAATGMGQIRLSLANGATLTLTDALHVPNAAVKLISVGRLCDTGHHAVFKTDTCDIITTSGQRIVSGTRHGVGLYALNSLNDTALIARNAPTLLTWHLRTGHINYDTLLRMSRDNSIKGMTSLSSSPINTCSHCILGKQTRISVPKKRTGERAGRPLKVLYSDICGPHDVPTLRGKRYTLEIIDDYSSYGWSFLLRTKSEAAEQLRGWMTTIERQTELKIGIFRTDNGGEYTSRSFEKYLQDQGILHQYTAPYSSAQNGKVERVHRTLWNRNRATLSSSGLITPLWGEIHLANSYIRNITPSTSLWGRSPHELFTGHKPDLSHLRELGCRAFVYRDGGDRAPKLYNRSVECILVGYAPDAKAYRCWNPEKKRIYVTRQVTFIESQDMPASLSNTTSLPSPQSREDPNDDNNDSLEPLLPVLTPRDCTPQTDLGRVSLPLEDSDAESSEDLDTSVGGGEIVQTTSQQPRRSTRLNQEEIVQEQTPQLRRSTRDREASSNKFERTMQEVRESAERVAQRKLDESEALDTFFTSEGDPDTWEEARNTEEAEQWKLAYQEELQSLRNHNVYELIPPSQLPSGRKPLGCRPVFKLKRDQNNNPIRYKVRLVGKGYSQIKGVDFHDTYAPVTRTESLRILLDIAAAEDWEIHQIDIKTAFLYGELEEEVYMQQPQGFEEQGKENWPMRLRKAIYGLKQGGRQWNKKLDAVMKSFGFSRVHVDHALYYRKTTSGTAMIAVHVDDMAIAASSLKEVIHIKTQIQTVFKIDDIGEVKWLLGMGITRDRENKTIALNQTAYIDRLLERFQLQHAYTVSTPLDPHVHLTKALSPSTVEEQEEMKEKPYRSLIGGLQYASLLTRPDITFATNKLSQYLENPGKGHWEAAKRVLRYLKGTRTHALILGGHRQSHQLQGYVDSDWAECHDTSRSTSGYIFTLGSGAISWSSKRQTTVATSSCEAEYVAAGHATKEGIWLRMLLEHLDLKQQKETSIYMDNQGAAALTKDQSFHARTKHIRVAHHFIRDEVDRNEITFPYVHTSNNLADIFTKALKPTQHIKLRAGLGLSGQDESGNPTSS